MLKAVQSGRITTVTRDGKTLIDPLVADIQWAANTRERTVPAPEAPVVPPSEVEPSNALAPYDRSMAAAKRETHEANLAAMREAKEAGALVERERVARAATDAAAVARTALERLPGLALELAAMTDAAVVRARLTAAVHDVLTDLCDGLRGLAGAPGGGGAGVDDGRA